MKKMIIKNCAGCLKYCVKGLKDNYVCTHPDMEEENMELKDISVFHTKCKLEDDSKNDLPYQDKIKNMSYQDILIEKLFFQGCYNHNTGKYDHNYIHIYEDVQKYLIQKGIIKKEQCELLIFHATGENCF